jgi:hypothetical protein
MSKDNNIKHTCKGDHAKIHDPTKHLSSECATANQQEVHCESTSSEV